MTPLPFAESLLTVKRICVTIVMFVIMGGTCTGQIDTTKLDSDELFALAREKAFAGHREEAQALCRTVLVRSPSYSDARILLGRIHAWEGRRAEARTEFLRVIAENPTYKDAQIALLDVELWDDKYEQALELSNMGLKANPSDEDFLLRKARALKALGRHEEAQLVLMNLEDINPSNLEAASLRQGITESSILNSAGANYASDLFSDDYDPMHAAYVQLSRRTAFGSLIARMNFARRFKTQGMQTEIDMYPRLGDGVYAYLNYGFSASDLFPRHRAGAELYTKLPGSTEGSVGLRHLYFGPSSSVTIYTGSFGLYFGNYWVSFRPYLIPNDAGVSKSASITLRRYIGEAENFLSLRAGIGFSADERTIQSSLGFLGNEVFYLKSQTVGIGWQQRFATFWILAASFDVTNQELSYDPGRYVVMYSSSVGFRIRF